MEQENHGRIPIESKNEDYIVFTCKIPDCGYRIAIPLKSDGELKVLKEGKRMALHAGWTSDQLRIKGILVEEDQTLEEYLSSTDFWESPEDLK